MIEIKSYTGEMIARVDNTDDLREAVTRLARQGVSLRYADLSGADLGGADLTGADLSQANLTNANLSGADLYGANLVDANLVDADLRGADLNSADLYDADLCDTNLHGANLSGANLRNATLNDAYLTGSDLYGVDFTGADVRGVRLAGARLNNNANLAPFRDDLYAVLSHAPVEVPALIKALERGKVNGSVYCDGECGCLIGTLALAAGAKKTNLACSVVHNLQGNGSRPIEMFFLAIRKGDTPGNNQFAKLAHEWATEWLEQMRAAFGVVSD